MNTASNEPPGTGSEQQVKAVPVPGSSPRTGWRDICGSTSAVLSSRLYSRIAFYTLLLVTLYVTARYAQLACCKYLNVQTNWPSDLLQFDQILQNTINGSGQYFHSAFSVNRIFDNHMTLSLIPLAALYFLFPSVLTLLIVQVAALTFAALAIYGIARRLFDGSAVALLFPLLYLSNPALYWIALDDFIPETFCVLFLFLTTLAFLRKDFRLYVLLLLAFLFTKENMAAIGILGAVWMSFVRPRKWWITTLALSATHLAVSLFFVRTFSNIGPCNYLFFKELNPTALFHATWNGELSHFLLQPEKCRAFLSSFQGFNVLSVFSPHVLVLGLSEILKNLLVLRTYYIDEHGCYYYSAQTAIAFLAAMVTLRNAGRLTARLSRRPWLGALLIMAVALAFLVAQVRNVQSHVRTDGAKYRIGLHSLEMRTLLAMVPPDASIAMDSWSLGMACGRTHVTIFNAAPSNDLTMPDYVLFNHADPEGANVYADHIRERQQKLLQSDNHLVLARNSTFTLLKRIASPKKMDLLSANQRYGTNICWQAEGSQVRIQRGSGFLHVEHRGLAHSYLATPVPITTGVQYELSAVIRLPHAEDSAAKSLIICIAGVPSAPAQWRENGNGAWLYKSRFRIPEGTASPQEVRVQLGDFGAPRDGCYIVEKLELRMMDWRQDLIEMDEMDSGHPTR